MDRVSPCVVCSWWRKVSTVWRREGVKKGCQEGGMRVRSGGVGGDCGGGGDEDGDEDDDEEGEEGIVGMVGIMRECVVWGTVVMVMSNTAVSYMCMCVCIVVNPIHSYTSPFLSHSVCSRKYALSRAYADGRHSPRDAVNTIVYHSSHQSYKA